MDEQGEIKSIEKLENLLKFADTFRLNTEAKMNEVHDHRMRLKKNE